MFCGREKEISELMSLAGAPVPPPVPIWIWGGSSVGKTSVVEHALSSLENVQYAIASCIDEDRISIISKVIGIQLGHARPCMTAEQLITRSIEQAKEENDSGVQKKTRWIVLDDLHTLPKTKRHYTWLAAMLRVCELAPIGIICISLLEPACFLTPPNWAASPFSIHFRSYSEEELVEILIDAMEKNAAAKFSLSNSAKRHRPGFVKYLVSSLIGVAPVVGVRGLKQVAFDLFPKYLEPLRQGKCTDNQADVLQRSVRESIRIVLRQNVAEMIPRPSPANSTAADAGQRELMALNSINVDGWVPRQEAAIILSAYLCSVVNKAKDGQLFSLVPSTKRLRRGKPRKETARASAKNFKLSRLIKVFRHVMEKPDSWEVTHDWLATVNSLVAHGVLQRLQQEMKLSGDRLFRFLAAFEFVQPLAEMLQYDLAAILDSN